MKLQVNNRITEETMHLLKINYDINAIDEIKKINIKELVSKELFNIIPIVEEKFENYIDSKLIAHVYTNDEIKKAFSYLNTLHSMCAPYNKFGREERNVIEKIMDILSNQNKKQNVQ